MMGHSSGINGALMQGGLLVHPDSSLGTLRDVWDNKHILLTFSGIILCSLYRL